MGEYGEALINSAIPSWRIFSALSLSMGRKICTNPADFILSAIPWNHVTTGKVGAMEMANVRDAVNAVITAIMAQKDYLTAVDAKTGDGDHGLNMARGFTAAEERLAELAPDAPVSDVLHHIGRAFIENVGGAAGPLYCIAFVRAGEAVNEKTRLDVHSFEKLFTAGIDAIQRRGRAERGDKTMLDTLIPIRDAFRAENADGKSLRECLEDALNAGRAGAEYTKTIAARRGRAALIGPRSIGIEDPGAMSSLIMFRALCSYLRG